MSNVRVAVRVRPLSKREIEQGAKIVVEVDGENVRVTNLKVPSYQEHDNRARIRQFLFDFCYWSVDPTGRHYSSQEMIYEDLGSKVLDAVFEGFNACVLAYGQSGSGKTYTMMGCNGDLGLTPRICQGLFDRMMKVKDERLNFRTEVSFLEIYNERVGDLLRTTPSRRQRPNLRVREHPKLGPCVQDLSKHVVTDFRDVQALIERGIQNRKVAATKLHDHSSRSHAIFTISFTQARLDEELPSEMVSKIHLVDLAGSERATVHTNKIRLKEGANINKSLVALGGVICALAERSSSASNMENSVSPKSHNVSSHESFYHRGHQTSFVPYRDSVLTWLLKDSLGGNSKTVMIAAVSPASTAYNETISTLRYTQRAKRIINKPVINEDPNVRLIRELKAEIARLREKLSNAQMAGSLEPPVEYSVPVAEIIIRNQDKAQELTRSWIEKWDYFRQHGGVMESCRGSFSGLRGTQPYMIGVSDVSRRSGVRIFYLKDMTETESEDDSRRLPDIILTGEKVTTSAVSLKNGVAISGTSTCLRDIDGRISPRQLPEISVGIPVLGNSCTEGSGKSQSTRSIESPVSSPGMVTELMIGSSPDVDSCSSDVVTECAEMLSELYVDGNHSFSKAGSSNIMEELESTFCNTDTGDVDDGEWSGTDDFSYYDFENDLHQCSSPGRLVSARRLSPIRECPSSGASTPLLSNEEKKMGNHVEGNNTQETCVTGTQEDTNDKYNYASRTYSSTAVDSDSLNDIKQCDSVSNSDEVSLSNNKPTEKQVGSAPFHAYLSLTGCRSDTSTDCEREPDPLPVYSRHTGGKYRKRARTALFSYNRNIMQNGTGYRSSPKSGDAWNSSSSSSDDESMSRVKGRSSKGGGRFEQIISENKRKKRKKTMVKRKLENSDDPWTSPRTSKQDWSSWHNGGQKTDLKILDPSASPPPLPRPSLSMRSFSTQGGSPIIPDVSFQGRCVEKTTTDNGDQCFWSGRPNSFWLCPPGERDSRVKDEGSNIYDPRSENSRMPSSHPSLCDSFVADSLEELRDIKQCGKNEQSNDEILRRNQVPYARKRTFDASQSWPSCDSLTMVYMGPEWGSTETNIVASLQSLEDQDKSDANSERLVDSDTGEFVSTGSHHSSSRSSVETGRTFTICNGMNSQAPVCNRQRTNTSVLPWVKLQHCYENEPWAVQGYSCDELGSDSEPYCWKKDQPSRAGDDETCGLWNRSPGSTWAEVSTQTGHTNDTDSGIQTDATLQSKFTQTVAISSSVGAQSGQYSTEVACQTGPIFEDRGIQTDTIRVAAETQTTTTMETWKSLNSVCRPPSKHEYGGTTTCFCCPVRQNNNATGSSTSDYSKWNGATFIDNKSEAASTFSDAKALGFSKVSFAEEEESRGIPLPRCESGVYIGFHGDFSELFDFDFRISLRDGVLTKSGTREDNDVVKYKSSVKTSKSQESTLKSTQDNIKDSSEKEHEEEERDHWEGQSTRVCSPETSQQNETPESLKTEFLSSAGLPKGILNKDKPLASPSSVCFCHHSTSTASFANGTTFDGDQDLQENIVKPSSRSKMRRCSGVTSSSHESDVCKTSPPLVPLDVLSKYLDDRFSVLKKSMQELLPPWHDKLETRETAVQVDYKTVQKEEGQKLEKPTENDLVPGVNCHKSGPVVLPWDEEYHALPVPNRTVKCSATNQKIKTTDVTVHQQPLKCSCSSRLGPEQESNILCSVLPADEDLNEHLPEDVVQLLKECREVRKKAWHEITLAHGQLRMTTITELDPKCVIHGSKTSPATSS